MSSQNQNIYSTYLNLSEFCLIYIIIVILNVDGFIKLKNSEQD